MPRLEWPLHNGRPSVQIILNLAIGNTPFPLILLADTGAGSRNSGFEFILAEDDCLLCGGFSGQSVNLGGAYTGRFPFYVLSVQLPGLGFAENLLVVGVFFV